MTHPTDIQDDAELREAVWRFCRTEQAADNLVAFIKQREAARDAAKEREILGRTLSFERHEKPSRVQALDANHISITGDSISFGKTKPPYERVVIEYDKENKAIRFHEPANTEYGISYKVGTNPHSGVYGFRARPFMGILPKGYYKKVSDHTYMLTPTDQKEKRE